MKKLFIATACLAALVGGGVYAQTREPSQDQNAAQGPPDPKTVREALQAKAKRIPARNLAAALRAASDQRDDRARTVSGRPDLDALREDLNRTETEDAEQAEAANDQRASETRSLSRTAPPRPGLRPVVAARLKSADQDEVSRVRIPVLLPADATIRDRIKVYGMENIYTATAKIDAEASLSISGTCNRVVGGDPDVVAFRKRLAEGPKRLAGTGASYQISRNDFGVDLSFSKFGCGYVMTIECGDPGADPRCAADEYITGLAESMILANPELAGGE